MIENTNTHNAIIFKAAELTALNIISNLNWKLNSCLYEFLLFSFQIILWSWEIYSYFNLSTCEFEFDLDF